MSLKEEIRGLLKEEYPNEPNWHGFTKWWFFAHGHNYRTNPDRVKFVDGNADGGIDAIAFPTEDQAKDTIFIVQSKFYSSSPEKKDLLRFLNAVRAIKGKQSSFLNWLQTCREDLHGIYQKIRENRKRCKFIVIMPCCFDPSLLNDLKKEGIDVFDSNKIKSLFKQYKAGRNPRLEELKLKCNSKPLVIANTRSATVRIFTVKVHELAKAYYRHGDLLFSGNIRYALRGATPKRVRVGIDDTLTRYPDEFVYSHNGITIVGYGFRRNSGHVYIQSPSIVNGAQTVSYLGHPKTIQKTSKNSASVIIRLIEVKDNELLGEIETNVAYRSNNQNKVDPSDLMIDLPALVSLQRYFLQHELFLERKKGESRPYYCKNTITKELLAQILSAKESAKGASDAKRKQELFTSETAKRLFKAYSENNNVRLGAVMWARIYLAMVSTINQFSNKTRRRRAQLAKFAAITVVSKLLSFLGYSYRERLLRSVQSWNTKQEAITNFLGKSFRIIFSELLKISAKERKNEPAFYKAKESLEKVINRAIQRSKVRIRQYF